MKPTAWLRKAASSFSGSRYGSTPSSVTAPEVGGSSPPAIYSSVLLPAPEGPMMAADSPRRRVSEMPASTVRGPRGDGYCLAMFAISSIGIRGGDGLEDFERARRHACNAVMLTDAARAHAPQSSGELRGLPQAVDAVRQTARVAGFHQHSASRLFQNLRKRAPPGLRDGHAGGHGLQKENPLGLVVVAGHAQNIEAAQELDLSQPVESALVVEFARQSGLIHPTLDRAKIAPVLRRQVAGGPQNRSPEIGVAPQANRSEERRVGKEGRSRWAPH